MAEQEQRTETGAVSLQSIDLKGAVKVARNFFVDTFSADEDLVVHPVKSPMKPGRFFAAVPAHSRQRQGRRTYRMHHLANLHFEEVERVDNGDWLITFGYDRKTNNALARLGLPGNLTERVYLQVHVEGYSGEALAVKIRAV